MKNKRGFTLVELVVVIIIVGILSVAAVPVYNSYVNKAYMTEAKALLGAIITAEEIYFTEFGEYADESNWDESSNPYGFGKSKGELIDVDASRNKYYKYFIVNSYGGDIGYDVSITSEGFWDSSKGRNCGELYYDSTDPGYLSIDYGDGNTKRVKI